MELTYRYRLYPTVTQQGRIVKTCGCARFVYNQLLTQRTKEYRKTLSWKKAEMDLDKILKRNPFLKEVDSSALDWAKQQLNYAYHQFFRMEKEKDRYRADAFLRSQQDPEYELLETDLVGYPRYKRKKQGTKSYSTNAEEICIEQNRVRLPGIGTVKIKLHRPIPENAKPLYYTVMEKASGRYFLLVHLQMPDAPTREKFYRPMGIVFDPSHLAVRSDEIKVRFQHEDPRLRKQIKKAKRTLDRRVPGSRGYEEAYKRLAKLHEKSTNQRWDSQHKEARQITNAADTFYMEKPDVRVRKPRWSVMPGMGHMIWDESWWLFGKMIRYKAEQSGKLFTQIPSEVPIYGRCGICNKPVTPKIPKQTDWVCPHCGVKIKSELNAALNLRNMGARYIKSLERYANN